MKIFLIVFTVILSVFALYMLGLMLFGGKPFRMLLLNAALGIGIWIVLNLTARFTGIRLPVNPWSAASVGLFGIPAVCGLLLLKLIFPV